MNLIGHIKQQHFFRQTIAASQLSHAYILHGTQGIGKKQFAIELARGLLCPERKIFKPCDCPSCTQVIERAHPDFYLFDDKEGLSIENVRNVSEISGTTPYSSKYKVIIFDNVHIMCQASAAAANALLKTLEEPGDNTIFLLVTHKLDRVLPTIQSRSLKVNFDPLADKELGQVLATIDSSKDWKPTIKYAQGSVANAVALSDLPIERLIQCIDKRDLAGFGTIFLALSDKDTLIPVIGLIQSWFLSKYKGNLKPEYALFIQYMNKVIKNLDYNVNMPLVLFDFFTKLEEVV
ncbi:MAG: AAA family ATPase [Deferribacteraceae bacterium]|jgi:DNA polymerase-3 subunit delta'|nr:AAA family ATPase [Deferribacteraceae bacterium]